MENQLDIHEPDLMTRALRWWLLNSSLQSGKDRAKRFLRQRWHGKLLRTTWNGLTVLLSLDEPMQRKVFFNGQYSPHLTHVLRVLLKDATCVVDVGANIGIYTLLAVAQMNPNGKLYAFEPSRREFDILQTHVRLNNLQDRVNITRGGVSNEAGELALNVATGHNHGLNSFGQVIPGSYQELVRVDRLSAFLDPLGVKSIDVIKIDTEGWEYHVMQGAEKYLTSDQAPTLVYECDSDLLRSAGSSPALIYRLLNSYGYRLFQISKTGALNEVFEDTVIGHVDIVALPKAKFDTLYPKLITPTA